MAGDLDVGAAMAALADTLVASGVVEVAWPAPIEAADEGEATVGYPEELTYGDPGPTLDRATIPVFVVVGVPDTGDDPEGWPTRDAMARLMRRGAGTVRDALTSDLGGAVSDCHVTRVRTARIVTAGDIRRLAVRFDCVVTS